MTPHPLPHPRSDRRSPTAPQARQRPQRAPARRSPTSLGAAALLALGLLGSAQAATVVHNFDPGPNWRTTTDRLLGQQWAQGNFDATQGIAVQTFYTNPATTSLAPDSMMWNCGPNGDACRDGSGTITGGAGPLEAFFAYGFRIDPGMSVLSALLAVVADDFFHLRVNGASVSAALLDNNKNAQNQPVPIIVDIASFLRIGDNVVTLRAMDGELKGSAATCAQGVEVASVLGPFCQSDRDNEYVSVAGAAITVPEPSSLWLLGGALAALLWQTRGRREAGRQA